jgi:hypothetical protein
MLKSSSTTPRDAIGWKFRLGHSVADPGCSGLSRIPDPNFFHPGSQIRIKEFKYFNPNFF